jgi:hypothetical protein
MLYSAVIIMTALLRIIFDKVYLYSRRGLIYFLISIVIIFSESSPQWKYLLVDAKIAVQVENLINGSIRAQGAVFIL